MRVLRFNRLLKTGALSALLVTFFGATTAEAQIEEAPAVAVVDPFARVLLDIGAELFEPVSRVLRDLAPL